MEPDPLVLQFRATLQHLATADEEEILAAAMRSPAIHFALFCRIKNDDNEEIEPMPNILQLRMCEAFETVKDLGIRVRIIVTKPRRAGCSSFVEHIGYHSAMNSPIEGITISDNKEHSAEAMQKLGSYGQSDSYPWGVRVVTNPAHSISWSNGSKWTVDTAENPDAGAGGTYQFAHCSETSKWPQTTTRNDVKTMTCLAPAVSGMNTVMFSESTPEGARGWQFKTWGEAVTLDKFLTMYRAGIRPEEIWIKVFAAWFEFDSNRRRQPVTAQEIEEIENTLTDHEISEIEKYQLDWEQVAWRRDTIRTKCDGDPKIFSYYYPSDDVTCWLASGAPRFDMQIVLEMEMRAKQTTPEIGYLVSQDDKRVSWQVQHDGTGDIQIWEHPLPGLKYLVVLDPASSASQTVGADTDCHSLSVWRDGYHDQLTDRYKPAKRVARLKPPFRGEGADVAGHTARLSKFYGRCMVAMEVNIGLGILELLQLAGIPLYKRRPLSHRTGQIVEQYGFKMGTKEEREALISGLATAIQDRNIDPSCPYALAEYKSFIRWPDGKSAASAGKHDDDVMADAIAWKVLPSATTYTEHKAKHFDPPDAKSWRTVVRRW
ncbi:MAG: hypothetical protein RLZZ214_718 [Verrucomicrobiota bacterium]|jgi:hypothetical protein